MRDTDVECSGCNAVVKLLGRCGLVTQSHGATSNVPEFPRPAANWVVHCNSQEEDGRPDVAMGLGQPYNHNDLGPPAPPLQTGAMGESTILRAGQGGWRIIFVIVASEHQTNQRWSPGGELPTQRDAWTRLSSAEDLVMATSNPIRPYRGAMQEQRGVRMREGQDEGGQWVNREREVGCKLTLPEKKLSSTPCRVALCATALL